MPLASAKHIRPQSAVLALGLIAAAVAGAAPARAADPALAAAGDVACVPGRPTTPSQCQMAATANQVQQLAPTAVAALGDNQYENATLEEFDASFDPTWGAFKPLIRPAAGNHEYQTPNAAGYFAYFGPAAGDPTRGYYSYELGAWHVVVLNSNCEAVACRAGSTQERWLRTDLAAHRTVCTLAYWHHPLFTSGPTKRQPDNLAVKSLWNDLYAAGADLILNGHDHTYQRFAPQTPDGLPDPGRGIREFVVGTGGDDFYPFGFVYPNSQARSPSPVFGVLSLGLHARSYDWRFHALADPYTDSGSARCTVAGRPPKATALVGRDRLAGVLKRGLGITVRSSTAARVRVAVQLDHARADQLGFPKTGNALELGTRTLNVRAKRAKALRVALNSQARRRVPRTTTTPITVVVLVASAGGGRRIVSRSAVLRP